MRSSGAGAWLQLTRPHHWPKNLILVAPLFFDGGLARTDLRHALLPAVLDFILLSAAAYCLNDLVDRERDAAHPRKRQRPLPRGAIRPRQAASLAAILAAAGLLACLGAAPLIAAAGLAYLLINLLYNLAGVGRSQAGPLCIAAGFLVRVQAGGLAVGIPPSIWLSALTFLTALLAAVAKREAAAGNKPRGTVHLAILVGLVYTAYALTAPRTGPLMTATILPVIAGLARLVVRTRQARLDDPMQLLYRDPLTAALIGLWLILFGLVLHG